MLDTMPQHSSQFNLIDADSAEINLINIDLNHIDFIDEKLMN